MKLVNIEAIRERLERNERERILLNGLLHDSEALQQFDGAEQLEMAMEPPITKNKPKGSISYPRGLRAVLRQAGGKSMRAADIWEQMEKLGG